MLFHRWVFGLVSTYEVDSLFLGNSVDVCEECEYCNEVRISILEAYLVSLSECGFISGFCLSCPISRWVPFRVWEIWWTCVRR